MTTSTSRSRIFRTFGSQIYSQFTTVGIQLALVPLLLHAWGTERYGVWLLLSAVPTYLTFADLGFTLSAKNEMTIKVARGDTPGALGTYQSTFWLLNGMLGSITIVGGALLASTNLDRIFSLGSISGSTAATVLGLLGLNVLFSQYLLLFAGGLRCAGRPAEEVIWAATGRLGEGAATAVIAFIGGDLIAAAMSIVLWRLAFNIALFMRLRHVAPWLPLGYRYASRAEATRLLHPSLSFMLISIGQALMIQGPVVILGAVGTPLQVVVFSTSRTLARLGTSAANMFNYALVPEYSRLYGQGNIARFRSLSRLHLLATVLISAFYVGVLVMLGDWLLTQWTHGKVHVEEPFFSILLVAVALEMIWGAMFAVLGSINQHIKTARLFSLLALLGMIACYFAGQAATDLAIVTAVILIVHLLMLVITSFSIIGHAASHTCSPFSQKQP